MKLRELAEKTFSSIEQGDENLEINAATGLDIAAQGEITFLANMKYTPQTKDTKASAIFLNETAKIERNDIAILRAKDPKLAYTRALQLFNPAPLAKSFIHPKAVIDDSAKIAETAEIHANAVIGANCKIAENVRISTSFPRLSPRWNQNATSLITRSTVWS